MYKFEIDASKKIFKIVTSGMFKLDEAEAFVAELEKKIKSVDPKQYTLVLDSKEQKPSGPDVVSLQEKAINLYVDTPFAKRYSIVFDSVIALSQIKRLGKNKISKNITFIDSMDQVK